MDTSVIGKCGLYCPSCSIYRAQRDDDELRKEIAKKHNCSIEEVRCNGCGDLTSECWGNNCKIVMCLRSKNLNYCYECSDFQTNQCSKYASLAETYLRVSVDIRSNLSLIKENKIEEFLYQSSEKHKCPTCNQPLAAFANNCHKCGQKIG